MITKIKAKLISKNEIAKDIWELKFSVGGDFWFNSGQYIWLITSVGRRAYSISSSSIDKTKHVIPSPSSIRSTSILSISESFRM